jgi:hypothetical protein
MAAPMDDATKRKVRRKVEADIAVHQAEIDKLRAFLAYVEADGEADAVVPPARVPGVVGPVLKRPQRRTTAGGPKLADRVMAFFNSEPASALFTPQDVEAALRTQGWEPTENGPAVLRRTLRELAAGGKLSRPDERHYQIVSPEFGVFSSAGFATGGGTS